MVVYTLSIPDRHKSAQTDALIINCFEKYISETQREKICTPCVKRTPDGKPYITDFPGVSVSVTHTENRIFIAFDQNNFGIDAEKSTRKIDRKESIAKKYFSLKENEFIFENPTKSDARFVEIWVKKEALVKYNGTGLRELSKADTFASGLCFTRLCFEDFTVFICSESAPKDIKIYNLD